MVIPSWETRARFLNTDLLYFINRTSLLSYSITLLMDFVYKVIAYI